MTRNRIRLAFGGLATLLVLFGSGVSTATELLGII